MGCCGNNAVDANDVKFEGPIANRVVRDVIMLLVFIAFLAGMAYVMLRALLYGNPLRVVYGGDSWGNVCNQANSKIDDVPLSGMDMTGLKYTFYYNTDALVNAKSADNSTIICIRICPDVAITNAANMTSYAIKNDVRLCDYDVAKSNYFSGIGSSDRCPSLPILKQIALLNRCVPEAASNVLNNVAETFSNILNQIDSNMLEKMSSDLHTTWLQMVYLVLIGLAGSIAMFLLLRFFAVVFIWTVVIGIIVGLLAATIYCWYSYVMFKATYDALTAAQQTSKLTAELYGWLGGAIAVSIVAVVVLLILFFLRKHIALVIQLFKEAGRAVISMPLLMLEPLWTLLVLGFMSALLIAIFLFIETSGIPYKDTATGHVKYAADEQLKYLKWYHLFGFYWITEFILASQELVIAGAVASWFFTRDKSKLGWPILDSRIRLLKYHLGSLAFGSLIIAIVKFVRAILSFIEARLQAGTGACCMFCLKCFKCCLWCLEKILKFLNRNAYIEIAIYGYSFCAAAKRAFTVLVSNALRVLAINSMGDFVLFLAKVAVVAVVVVSGMQLFKSRTDIYYTWFPILLVSIFAYFIASCFVNVYEMAIDTVFLCFCEDSHMNDGITRPYFMSIQLMKFVDNSEAAIALVRSRDNRVNPMEVS